MAILATVRSWPTQAAIWGCSASNACHAPVPARAGGADRPDDLAHQRIRQLRHAAIPDEAGLLGCVHIRRPRRSLA
jgi:hypothetical protein